MHELQTSWKSFNFKEAPYVLPGDEIILDNTRLFCRFASWEQFVTAPNFGDPARSELHLDLLPMPFIGNLKSASVFLLMLNPGFGPHDYFGEHNVPDYRNALIQNLIQSSDNSFLFLDPRHSWHAGFCYWHDKLRGVIKRIAKDTDISYGDARRFVQKRIAVLQLAPYHSVGWSVPDRTLNAFRSVELARSFVHDKLIPRARSGDCLIVAVRKVNHWRLPSLDNIVAYSATEARGAHLGPDSRGGAAILEFLRRTGGQRP
jgi:hypothetical protein